MREQIFPFYFEVLHYSPVWKAVYLVTLLLGAAIGVAIAKTALGRWVVCSAGVLTPLTAFALHVTVLTLLGQNSLPPDGFWFEVGANVGAALSLFFKFSFFFLPGAALGTLRALPVGAEHGSIIAALVILGVIYCVWISPYCVGIVDSRQS